MFTEIIIITPEIGHIAGTGIKTITEEGETIVTEVAIGIIGPTTEITVGLAIDRNTEEMIVIKGIAIGTKIMVDLAIEMEGIEAAQEKVPNPGAIHKTDMRVEGRVEVMTEIGTGPSLDLDPLLDKY